MASEDHKGTSSSPSSLQYITPEESKGPLSFIGDPLGKVLEKGLSPLGHVTGAIGNPNGQALLDVQKQAKKEHGYTGEDNGKPDRELPGGERIGGKEQTGENPLGL